MVVEHPPYLSQNDVVMWMVEADPLLRSTIVGITVLDHAPSWDQVTRRVERVTRHVPALRERVMRVPLHPTMLRWAVDPSFDLGYHLRHLVLPPPGTMDELLAFARKSAATGFDKDRPLWEFTLVEGLEGGRAAFVMKAHHVLTDGIGAVQLAAYLFDFEPDADPDGKEPPPAVVARDQGTFDQLREIVEHDIDGVVDFARTSVRSVVPSLLHALRHPGEAVTETVEMARSVGRALAPVFDTKSPVMTGRQMINRFSTYEVPLSALKTASKAAGGTVNDGFLAGITGGLRLYHEHHGAEIEDLRVAMPISMRSDHHEAGGNHVTVMRFSVPAGIADPAERIRALHAVAADVRAEPALPYSEALYSAVNLMPRAMVGSMLKHIDFLASNVPGVPIPMYLAGAEVLRYYPFGPTAGSSVNITLMSYRELCCIGVNTDTAAIPDHEVFLDCLDRGFAEVLTLAPA